MKSNIYYNPQKMLSHNALFNFVVGVRGNGKTYAMKKHCIKSYLKTGKKFIWIRRYKTELKNIKKFFDDIYEEFPNKEFKISGGSAGGSFYIDNVEVGVYSPLSVTNYLKSVSFKDFDKIVFDEFIIPKSLIRYLPNEIFTFLELYETVDRSRDITKCFFVANAIDFFNPYFINFNINIPNNKNSIYRKNDVLLEITQTEEFKQHKRETRFYKMLNENNINYADYAIENKFLQSNLNLVRKPNSSITVICGIKKNDKIYTVWRDRKNVYYILDKPKNTFFTFTFNENEIDENTTYYKTNNYKLTNIKNALRTSTLFFGTEKIKAELFQDLKKLF